ncbi:MAG: FlgD immunoglobulin-like domain containing protein [candidate division Zixibacteria bacterium]|jgi:hypothetical protein|nr:FlgD immunoglobulin-like domain containing protein [candidate division Zixibacteria bacterium]
MQILKVLLFSAALSPVLAIANPPEPPIFTGCPTEVTGNHCDSLLYSVVAIDPNSSQPGYSRNVRYHLVSGPGTVDFKTGLWLWHPEPLDVYHNYQVEIAASANDTMTTGDQNCRFTVRALDQPPVWNDRGWQMYEIDQDEELVVQLEAYDPDECDDVGFFVYQFLPEPTGAWSLDSLTGKFRFAPVHADRLTRFHVSIAVSFRQGSASIVYNLVIDVGPVAAQILPIVRIDTISGIRPGETFDLPVWLERTDRDFNAGRFHIAYDSRFFELNEVRTGQFLTDCGWNEVEWQDVTFTDHYPGFLNMQGVQITLDAGDEGSALCYRPDSLHAELFVLNFTTANDTSLHTRGLPVRFYFSGCYDDYLIDNDTEYKCIADRVRYVNGNYLPLPDELPSFSGIPLDCFANPYAQRTTTYIHGVVSFADTIQPDLDGDCDGDGDHLDPADIVCFKHILGYSNIHIAEFVHTIRTRAGEIPEMTPFDSTLGPNVTVFHDTVANTISISGADSISALYIMLIRGSTISYVQNEHALAESTPSLFTHIAISAPLGAVTPLEFPTFRDGILLAYTGRDELVDVEASTRDGRRMPVRIIQQPAPYRVVIQANSGYGGDGHAPDEIPNVDVYLENAPAPIGGFSFLLAYDRSRISLYGGLGLEHQTSPLYADCGWEYFTFRQHANSNCEPNCPSGLLTVVGLAETNNGPYHPDTCNLAETESQLLFTMPFLHGGSATYVPEWVPIDFYWTDCADNALSSIAGDTLFVSHTVKRLQSHPLPDTANDPYWVNVTDETTGFPTYTGVQQECFGEFGPDVIYPVKAVELVGGGVLLNDGDLSRGDLNLDGIPYTIADAVMFSRYLLYGDTVFLSIPGVQFPLEAARYASDINADGDPFTIEDFVCLIRVIYGDAVPYPPQDPAPHPVTFTLSEYGYLSYEGEYDLGAVRIVYEGDCAPGSLLDQMEMQYYTSGDSTVVLLYSFDGEYIEANHGHFMDLLPGGCAAIRSIVAADYWGRAVQCIYDTPADVGDETENLPDHFALEQNYPNPFNPATTIEFALPVAADTRITIYNIQGRIVRTLADTHLPAGYHAVVWNGLDNYGNTVASGVYLYRIDAAGFAASRKMLLLK